jgi:hypothetical protein
MAAQFMSSASPAISKCRENTLCDPKVPAFPWVLCLSLTENKMGIRHVWWFQHETVTRFNAKYKQRRREVCLPKGALPTGSGLAPDWLTKSHKDGRVRAQQPNSCVAHEEQEIWPPQNQPGGREGSFHAGVCPLPFLLLSPPTLLDIKDFDPRCQTFLLNASSLSQYAI